MTAMSYFPLEFMNCLYNWLQSLMSFSNFCIWFTHIMLAELFTLRLNERLVSHITLIETFLTKKYSYSLDILL